MTAIESPEFVWDGDVPVLVAPDEHPCDNPFDWQPIDMDDVPVQEDE